MIMAIEVSGKWMWLEKTFCLFGGHSLICYAFDYIFLRIC